MNFSKIFFKIFILSIIITISSLAQNKLSSHFDIGGTILYSYSNSTLQYDNIPSYFKVQQLQFEPELAYYINPSLEVVFDINYTMEIDKSGLIVFNPDVVFINGYEENQMHRLGILLGPAYNYEVNKDLNLFIGTKLGISETRWIVQFNKSGQTQTNYSDSGWRDAGFLFPCFFGGIKICLDPEWSLLFKVQYIRTNGYEGIENQNNDLIVFGIGVSAFL